MKIQHIRIAAIAACALALAACSSNGGSLPNPAAPAQTQSLGGGTQPGIDVTKVHVMRTAFAPYVGPDTAHLVYRNGLVETKAKIFVVYWGFNVSGSDPNGEQAYATAFLNGVGGSPWLNTVHQYYEIVSGLTHHIQNKPSELLNTWVDSTNPVPNQPTDAQVQAEAQAAEAHFGYNGNASYVVATPHGHNTPGFGTQWCAYHGETVSTGGKISYTNLPYMTDAGRNCGENFVNPGSKGILDGVSIVEGHELAESQTDPFPFTGWYDTLNGEIGDICAWRGLADTTLSTGTFAVQPLWSNKGNICALHTP